MQDDPPGQSLNPLRILVREVNWLGDAIMSTPALQRLRQHYPQAHITLLCPEKLRDLWLHFQCVNDVLTIRAGQTPWTVGRRLRPERFDTALVFPNSPRAALEAWFARIPRRIGYSQPWRNWYLTQAVAPRAGRKIMRKKSPGEIRELIRTRQPPSPGSQRRVELEHSTSHQANEYLHLVAQLGACPNPIGASLCVQPNETLAVARKFGLSVPALTGKPVLALNPGAEYGPAKRWPVANFIAAAMEIRQRTDCVLLILGAGSDIPLANEIYSALRTPNFAPQNLAGRTSLRELMAVLRMTRVLLTNDTGPMHLAAALGTSVVVPFGSTSPELTAPGLVGDRNHYLLAANAPCAPCFRRTCPIDFRCMTAISVASVVTAVVEACALAPEAVQRQN
jgi:heptosyltransferase-2